MGAVASIKVLSVIMASCPVSMLFLSPLAAGRAASPLSGNEDAMKTQAAWEQLKKSILPQAFSGEL